MNDLFDHGEEMSGHISMVTAGVRTESFHQNDIKRVVRQQGWKSAESMTAHFLELNEQDIYSSNISFFLYVEMPAQVGVNHSEKFGLEATVLAEQSLDSMTLSCHDRLGKRSSKTPVDSYLQERHVHPVSN
jgi:hypothetical protein